MSNIPRGKLVPLGVNNMSVLINIFEEIKDNVSKLRRFRSGATFNIEVGKAGAPFDKSIKLICGGLTVFEYGIACAPDGLIELSAELAARPDIMGVRRTKYGLEIEVEPVGGELTTPQPPLPVETSTILQPPLEPLIESIPLEAITGPIPIEAPDYVVDDGGEDEDIDEESSESELVSKLSDGGSPFVNLSTVRTEGTDAAYEDQNYVQAVSRGLAKGILTRKGSHIFHGERNIGNGVTKAAKTIANEPELYGILNV